MLGKQGVTLKPSRIIRSPKKLGDVV